MVEEDADVQRLLWGEDSCGYILKESTIVERPDGTKQERPRRVRAELQPVVFEEPVEEKEKIKTAGELVLEALRKQEEAVGSEARAMALDIVNQCAEVALTGKHVYSLPENSNPDVLSMVFRELRNRGYRLKRYATDNTLEIKWATKIPTKKKKRIRPEPEPEIQVVVQKQDQEKRKQQLEAAQERKRKLKARSVLPD